LSDVRQVVDEVKKEIGVKSFFSMSKNQKQELDKW